MPEISNVFYYFTQSRTTVMFLQPGDFVQSNTNVAYKIICLTVKTSLNVRVLYTNYSFCMKIYCTGLNLLKSSKLHMVRPFHMRGHWTNSVIR